MSRSEHGNARDRTDPVDRARKARIKRLRIAERQRQLVPVVPAPSSAAAIRVIGFEHPDDVRGVMDRMPSEVLAGIASVTRAPSLEGWLGSYDPDSARIAIHQDDGDVPIYRRLRLLATLVHEIGHHVDCRDRFSRARARADRVELLEDFAEQFAETWIADAVVPYLEQAYPDELAAFRRWLVEHAGVELPLELLVAKDTTALGTADAFEILLRDVAEGEPPIDIQVTLAFNLHYAYHFDLALAILDGVLAREPDHAKALRWRDHIRIDHQYLG